MYNRLYTQEKKIHTLVALPILLGLFLLIFFIFAKPQKSVPDAKESAEADVKVQVTNLTSAGATACWKTADDTTGWIEFGETETDLSTTLYDERDLSTQLKKRAMHCVPMKGLASNKKYFFRIVSNEKRLKNTYLFTTTPKYGLAKNIPPVICKAFGQNGSPLQDGVAVVEIAGAYPLSAYVKSTGECLVGLSNVLSRVDATPLSVTSDTKVRITIYDTRARFSLVDTTVEYVSALPSVVIGKKYTVDAATVGGSKNVLGESESVARTTEVPVPTKGVTPPIQTEIEILSPKDGAKIAGESPIFRGVLRSKREVQIEVEDIKSGVTTVKVDDDGVFTYSPSVGLPPGEHTVTFTVFDGRNVFASTSQTFTILKSGLGVLGQATPEATIVPTDIPVPTLESPTVAPTAAPVTESPPIPGANIFPFSIFSLALVLIGVGMLAIF